MSKKFMPCLEINMSRIASYKGQWEGWRQRKLDGKRRPTLGSLAIILPDCWSCTRQPDLENATLQLISTNWPTEIRLVVRLGKTKTSFREEEISPVVVIGKWLPLAVWILRFLEYLFALVRKWALFVVWLEAPESKYQVDDVGKALSKSPKVENADMITCWIISGVTGWIGIGVFCVDAAFTELPVLVG